MRINNKTEFLVKHCLIFEIYVIPAYFILTYIILIEETIKEVNYIWLLIFYAFIFSIIPHITYLNNDFKKLPTNSITNIDITYTILCIISITTFLILAVEGILRQIEKQTWILLILFLSGLIIIGFIWIIEYMHNRRVMKLHNTVSESPLPRYEEPISHSYIV